MPRDYSTLTDREMEAEIKSRLGGLGGYYCSNATLALELLDWLAEREGEIWVITQSMDRAPDGELVPLIKPYPARVMFLNYEIGTPLLPFGRAICTAVLMWLDMDKDLRRLAREAGEE